ncbi:MAG TPA: SufD family Fe-S cluster assembly protein [Steroidobacteraceae bacterium]|jgi:Fe-S cluster assembly protein SufD|nr:SufD family Fe-S cluster assembly protein [Steroidobacteraceae bacterium]
MSSTLTNRIVEDYASVAAALPAAGAAAQRRRGAIEALRAVGLPGARDENWKYANLRPLERLRFVPAVPAPPAQLPATEPAPLPGFARYVLVDGVLAAALSAPLDATAAQVFSLAGAGSPAGATPAAAGALARPWRELQGDERFALLNAAFATDGLGIRVAGASSQPVRIELLFIASADQQAGASYPRVELTLADGAHLELIERHVSAGMQPSFVTSAVTVDMAPRATLQHYRLQELNAHSTLFDTLSAQLAARASYRLHGIGSGAQSARSTLMVHLGEGAQLQLAAAAIADRQQVLDTYALVEHTAPDARTVQTFRGIAAGRARVGFNGKIVVQPAARGSDSQQSLRGLLAGAEAEIDLRPQLEIHTDEVRCSHGATAGKLDENMLFYLLSRGLDRDSAQRLLKWAFLEDVIAQVALPALRRQIEERLVGRLRDEQLRELL